MVVGWWLGALSRLSSEFLSVVIVTGIKPEGAVDVSVPQLGGINQSGLG